MNWFLLLGANYFWVDEMTLPRIFNFVIPLLFAINIIAAGAASAQQPVEFSTQKGAGYGRILVSWPEGVTNEDVKLTAKITNGVLVVSFSEILTGNTKIIRDGLPDQIALARMDTDGQTIRIALRSPAKIATSNSFNVFAIDLIAVNSNITPPAVSSPKAEEITKQKTQNRKRVTEELEKAKRQNRSNPALPLQVRFAESSDNTRISFDWTDQVEYRVLERESGLDLVFDRPSAPALAAINAGRPAGLLTISALNRQNKTIVSVNTEPGYQHRVTRDATRIVLDLYRPQQQDIQPIQTVTPEQQVDTIKAITFANRPDPVPASGLVPVQVTANGTALHLKFDWKAPVGAAAFRRGENLWLIFDANAKIDLAELINGGNRHILDAKQITGSTYSGVLIHLPAASQVEARPDANGSQWTFVLDDKLEFANREIYLRREADGSGPGRLAAKFINASTLLWVDDKDVGDTLAVITGTGPASGISTLRRFVEVSSLPSAHGMAFEINADDLDIEVANDLLTIKSPLGLNLTPSATPLGLNSGNSGTVSIASSPAISASPGFIDFDAWKKLGGDGNFHKTYSALLRRVAIEDTDPEARMMLAKFLIANELGAEALGALALAQALDPMLVQDARFRSLRGVANLQMNRIYDAKADFAAQTLNRDPSAALWRGLLAAKTENWTEARQNFEKGREALYLFTPEWQAIFHTAFARAAMNLNDLGTAKQQLQEIFGQNLSLHTQLDAAMAKADLHDRNGETEQAIKILNNVIETKYEPLVVRSIFEQTRIKQKANLISPLEASDILENLRYRWRGDEVELEAVRTLGAFYSQAGDYRRAMEAMSLAIRRFPDSPVARRLLKDLNQTFQDLFLKGGADAMDPVQALALFYQFQDFTPLGTEGDRMLRRMADRLIAFDLLPQAAELLQYQVDKKLYGIGKAQIATDLALVYLMDKQPEKALRAIHSSRQSRLPRDLNRERRLLEARALVELGRTDHALDLIEMDRTRDADFLRADIVWSSKDWPKISRLLVRVIERHLHNPTDLNDVEANLVLRATIASALADDQSGFTGLVAKWQQPITKTKAAEAFALITSKTSLNGVAVKDLARTLGGTDSMRSYLEQYRSRLKQRSRTAGLEQTGSGLPG